MKITQEFLQQRVALYAERINHAPQLKAALIDMDGVLYDSMKNHTKSWHRMATELGIECTREEFYLYEGMTGTKQIQLVYKRQFGEDLPDDKAAEYYEIKAQYFIDYGAAGPMPGAAEMLNHLRDAGIMRVLVTGSAQLSLIESLNRDFPGIFCNDARVTALDVKRGKPDPEPYLMGQQKANAQPWECMVIENAPLGVTAGHRAGSFVVGVTTGPVPAETMWEAGADLVVDSMPEFAQCIVPLIDLLKAK